MKLLKRAFAAPVFGSGKAFAIAKPIGFRQDRVTPQPGPPAAGITLPGNGSRINLPGFRGSGLVVSGSKMVMPDCEKSTLDSRMVGTFNSLGAGIASRYLSKATKKKALSFPLNVAGPPSPQRGR